MNLFRESDIYISISLNSGFRLKILIYAGCVSRWLLSVNVVVFLPVRVAHTVQFRLLAMEFYLFRSLFVIGCFQVLLVPEVVHFQN